MAKMGRKVSYNLTIANEEKEKKVREKWEEEGGRVTTAYVLNKAMSLLYDKEFSDESNSETKRENEISISGISKYEYIEMKRNKKEKAENKLDTLNFFKEKISKDETIVYFVEVEDDYSSFVPQKSEIAVINLEGKVLFNDILRVNSIEQTDNIEELKKTLRMSNMKLLTTFSPKYAKNGGMISVLDSEIFSKKSICGNGIRPHDINFFDIALEYTHIKNNYSDKGDVYLVPSLEKMMNEFEYTDKLETCLDKAKAIASVYEKVLVSDIEKYKSKIAEIEYALKAVEDGRIVFK